MVGRFAGGTGGKFGIPRGSAGTAEEGVGAGFCPPLRVWRRPAEYSVAGTAAGHVPCRVGRRFYLLFGVHGKGVPGL